MPNAVHRAEPSRLPLSRLFLSLALAVLAASPCRLDAATVNVAQNDDLQQAIDDADPGDTLLLEAGATFTGPIVLPYKTGTGTAADWITIRTDTPDEELPPGTRVAPGDAPLLARIVSPGSGAAAIETQPSAHHYKLIGLEVAPEDDEAFVYDLVKLGSSGSEQDTLAEVPGPFVIDRCYIHAYPEQESKRGIGLNSSDTAVTNSYVSDFKLVGLDSQAIGGWNGPGPFSIVNNYLEGSGDNVLFGGADPSVPNLIPSDIEIRGNYFFKPLTWYPSHPSYGGIHWLVKNLLELKNARRVVIDGNIFEHSWGDAQNGYAILFTVRNQSGTAPWSVVEDIELTHNLIRHTGAGVTVLGQDDNPSQQTARITIAHNVFEDLNATTWSGNGWFLLTASGIVDLVVDHNTIFQSSNLITATGTAGDLVFTNNIAPHNTYGIVGDNRGSGNDTLSTYFPGATFAGNVIPGASAINYPTGNFYPAALSNVDFVDLSGGDYHLAGTSPYKGQGTDDLDPGADIDAVAAAIAGAVSGLPAGTTPFGGSAAEVPGTIYAARFDEGGEGVAYHDATPGNSSSSSFRDTDVDMYGDSVLWLATGEWLEYTVDIAAASSTYAIVAQVGTDADLGSFHVELDGDDVTGTMTVPDTGSWAIWTSAIATGVTLPAGRHVLRFAVDDGFDGLYALRIVDTAGAQSPFGGMAHALPGSFDAVEFDQGGELVAYHDNTAGCEGDCDLREDDDVDMYGDILYRTTPGEWTEYTVSVATAGTYRLTFEVASDGGGGTFHAEVNGVDVTGPLTFPDTGGWSVLTSVVKTGVSLSSGTQVLRLVIDDTGPSGDAGSFRGIAVVP